MGNKENRAVIIIGDWFIDENWLVSRHNTKSSSHTGDIHYLSQNNDIRKRMISLCGASEILEVLANYKEFKAIDFIGFGAWNNGDDKIIQCTLCSYNHEEKHMTPYTLHGLKEITSDNDKNRACPYLHDECSYNPKLINLTLKNNSSNVSTNRIVRVYEGYGGSYPHLLYRFDWQLPMTGAELDYSSFEKELLNKNIGAVIIEDHGKGVATDACIEALCSAIEKHSTTKNWATDEELANIKWYIRSKTKSPSWMKVLKDKEIKARLRVVDSKLFERQKGQRRINFGNKLGRSSLELLGELTGEPVYKHGKETVATNVLKSERVAILFDDNTAVAMERQNNDSNDIYNIHKSIGEKQLINIGRTTMFFNALIAQDLSNNFSQDDFELQCYNALKCAYEWSKESSKAWTAEKTHFYGDPRKVLNSLSQKSSKKDYSEIGNYLTYKESWLKWNASSENHGILEYKKDDTTKHSLQVWRGECAIKGYICVGGPKRDRINEMLSSIAEFNDNKNPVHPLNCLLTSSPGWGKSYLAKSMADHFDMSFMEFSLSQMATANDLIDSFDSICSHQNRTDKKVLIFIDEINCEIEGNSSMGLLLSPIWDGAFIRNGKYYKLSPAVWMFASTETINSLIANNTNKGSDFVSRLNGPIVKLDSVEDNNNAFTLQETLGKLKIELSKDIDITKNYSGNKNYSEIMNNLPQYLRTEQVYLGVSLLNRLWGPINKVQKSVLNMFYWIVPINGIRSLEFFVSKFQYIQRGVVTSSNVPTYDIFPELIRHIIMPYKWDKTKDEIDKKYNLLNHVNLPEDIWLLSKDDIDQFIDIESALPLN